MYAPTSTDVMTFAGRNMAGVQLRPLLPNLNELVSGAVLGVVKSEKMHDLVVETLGEEKPKKISYIIDYSTEFGHYEVKVNDRNPERAAKIANLIPEVANRLIVEVSESTLKRNIEYVKAQLDTARIELERARNSLRDFRQQNIHLVMGQQSQMQINKNTEYLNEYDRLGVEQAQVRAEIDALREQMEREAQFFVEDESVTQDPTIQQLRNSLTEREMQLASMRSQYTEYHPAVIALEKEIDDLKKLLSQEVERLFKSQTKPSTSFYENLRQTAVQKYVQLTANSARRDALKNLIDASDQVLYSIPSLQDELTNLLFEERVHERVVESLVSRLTELQLQIGRSFQTFIVLEKAEVPPSPSFPVVWLNILLGVLFGFGGGLIYCTLLEYWEKSKLMEYADAEAASA